MKYLILLGDGMADRPIARLGGRTPLEAADKPNMDALASAGEMGLVQTVPTGMPPGSDVANLSVLGYDPRKYYSGRSPLEAVSIGAPLADGDVTFRVNLVTLSDEAEYADKRMLDYSSDEISSEESAQLMAAVQKTLGSDALQFYAGTSYRNLLVWKQGSVDCQLTAPHDISQKIIGDYLPAGDHADEMRDLMRRSYELLKDHPVNLARTARGLNPANSIWLWGQGTKPALPTFEDLYGKSGAVISAVDLLKGIALCARMKVIPVEGATGNLHTNFTGKAQAAADALINDVDFVYLHIEAPDECGHRGEVEGKVLAIEKVDGVLGQIRAQLDAAGEEYAILLLPDHPTPLETGSHCEKPVPYVLYRSGAAQTNPRRYTEAEAEATGIFVTEGHMLIKQLTGNR